MLLQLLSIVILPLLCGEIFLQIYPAANLFSRFHAISLLWKNAPSRIAKSHLPSKYSNTSRQIIFHDQLDSCEDIKIFPSKHSSFAIISCDPGRATWNTVMGILTSPNTPGHLFHLDYAGKSPQIHEISLYRTPAISPRPIQNKFSSKHNHHREKFGLIHPLGIDYYPETQSLFVIDHSPTGPFLHLFHYSPNLHEANLISSLYHSIYLKSPNSVLALGARDAYITNDHAWPSTKGSFISSLESHLAYPGGNIVYVNFNRTVDHHQPSLNTSQISILPVASGIPFANGITRLNQSTIAVASTSTPALILYRIIQNSHTHHLEKLAVYKSNFFPDNIWYSDALNGILLAGHAFPPSLQGLAKLKSLSANSPLSSVNLSCDSWVSIWRQPLLNYSTTPLYHDILIGGDFKSSTTAVYDSLRNIIIVTGLYEKGILMVKSPFLNH